MSLPRNTRALGLLVVVCAIERIAGCSHTTISGVPRTLSSREGCYARSSYLTSSGVGIYIGGDGIVHGDSTIGIVRSQNEGVEDHEITWEIGALHLEDAARGTVGVSSVLCIGWADRRKGGLPSDVDFWDCDADSRGHFEPAEGMSVTCGCSDVIAESRVQSSRLRRRLEGGVTNSSDVADSCTTVVPDHVEIQSDTFPFVAGVYQKSCESGTKASWHAMVDGESTRDIVFQDSDEQGERWVVMSTSNRIACVSYTNTGDPTSINEEDWLCDGNSDSEFTADERGDFKGVVCYDLEDEESCSGSSNGRSFLRTLEKDWWTLVAVGMVILLGCIAHIVRSRPKSNDRTNDVMAVEDAYPQSPSAFNFAWGTREPPKLPVTFPSS